MMLTTTRKLNPVLWRLSYHTIINPKEYNRRNNNGAVGGKMMFTSSRLDVMRSMTMICGGGCDSGSKPSQSIINVNETKFDKLLIANRGEIACRIITSARLMGIRTVAVYSSIDSHSKHVKLADEAVQIGGPKPSESYMNIERILEPARITGARAIHPGYGFLAENHKFVECLEQDNLIFIGPSRECIEKMGDKLHSKQIASEAGVHTIPGYNGFIENVDHCLEIAKEIGYPVMVKASAGGGGRGMRIAMNEKQIKEAYDLASAEAQNAFGDNRLILEKHIDHPRHIEIQILGDKYGNIVHLYERECSIQRRHQKIIEEAPSTCLDEATRSRMAAQAVALCKRIGYYSAGTVEFLLDASQRFYFLEMNTRLQVEHPITECITGIDLVAAMLRVAQGLPLDVRQEDVKVNGWALEARIYAEDPYKHFGTPSTGRIYKYQEPANIRCDSGVEEGDLVSIYYDPLIAKVIGHAATRSEVVQKTTIALDSFVLRGIAHNVPLLRDVINSEKFLRGDISTSYLTEEYAMEFPRGGLAGEEKKLLIASTAAIYTDEQLRRRLHLGKSHVGYDVELEWDLLIELPNEGDVEKFHVKVTNDHKNLTETNHYIKVQIDNGQWFEQHFKRNGVLIKMEDNILQLHYKKPDGTIGVIFKGALHELKVLPKVAHDLMQYVTSKPKLTLSKEIKAPMPGLMKSVNCKEGQLVHEGDVLCVIEAMKMQNSMNATTSGRIKKIHVNIGDRVSEDDVLIELE